MVSPFKPIENQKKHEKIVALLKHKVFSGEYRPGDRLPSERELAELLNVSRLTVREAYRALQMFGMIEIRRGQYGGAFICTPSSQSLIQSVSDLFRFRGVTLEEWTEARLIFELDIARLAVRRAVESDFERLEETIEVAGKKSREGELAHAENIQFHLCLAEIARNQILFTSYKSMMELLLSSLEALNVSAHHYRSVGTDHRTILGVLKKGDEALFLKTVDAHVRKAGKNLATVAKRSPLFKGNMT